MTIRRNARRLLSAVLVLVLLLSLGSAALAVNNPQTDTSTTTDEISAAQISYQIAKEGIVLLENENDVLPIAKEGDIALFGIGAIQTTKGGTGSGSVNNRIVYADGTIVEGEAIGVSVMDGFINNGYNVLTEDYLTAVDADNPNNTSGMGMGASTLADDPIIGDYLSDEELAEMAAATDTAFYTIRRNAGEGADRVIENDYNLSDNELANIATLVDTFDHVVVLLNVVNCDASWFADSGVEGLVLISNPGELGGNAVVDVLNGTENPSGHLVDTWASSIYDWPSTEYYSNINEDDPWADKVEYYYEDIFVGYRYFDTFAADKILYPFGYGLSYTTFDIDVVDVTCDAETTAVTVNVTNTGDVAGKQVVQVYFSAPEGELLKPYQELAAYGKTDELQPGESQTLTISYETTEMSSYSEARAAYILEAGDYIIRVGADSNNTVAAAVITLDETAVTEQLANKMSIDGYGVYPGGSSGASDEMTQEENVAQWEEFNEEFMAANEGGQSLENDDSADIALTLSAADIVTENPYEEAGDDPETEDVTLYVSATTETEYAGETGYDYADGEEYSINPVYFYADGASGELANYRVKSGSEEDGTAEYYTLMDVEEGTLTLEQFVSGLTISEMADIVEGGSKSPDASGQSSGGSSPNTANYGQDVVDYINSEAVDGQAGQTAGLYVYDHSIPSITNADGPAGLRISQSYTGLDGETYYQYCTAYPVGMMIAQTWNTDLAYLMGMYVGKEMLKYGVTEWLAPGMNIHRNPLCGRNFEYYSEDPVVAGMTGGYETLGVQSNPGVGVTLKHFSGNEQENSRGSQNDVVTERAFREIYLKQFEIAVKIAKPMGMMTTYGMVNGIPTANSYELIEDILRTEWGFDGVVMTDWGGSGGMTDALAMHAGNDLITPGGDVTSKILPYIVDAAPDFCLDEDGLSTSGGYPNNTMTESTWGTMIFQSVSTDWGDYYAAEGGEPCTVQTTEDAFENTVVYVSVGGGMNATVEETTAKGAIDDLVAEGAAEYTVEDGIVTITYYLKQTSLSDGTNYADTYADHPVTVTENAVGGEDVNTLSLADLQKSVIRILTVCMRSLQWQEMLDAYQVETGTRMDQYEVQSYTEEAGGGIDYVTVERG